VFEKRALRRISGPKRDEVIRRCRKLHSEELHNFSSTIIIRIIKAGIMSWTGNVARMGEEECI
jgi:hypothetical protein